MDSLSVLDIARLLESNSASDMAVKVGLKWPPLSPTSLKDILIAAGHPLQPIDLGIAKTGDLNQASAPDNNDVPITNCALVWKDPGQGTVRAAASFTLSVMKRGTGFGAPFPVQNTSAFVRPTGPLDYNTEYMWWVASVNRFGSGPSSPAHSFWTSRPPSPPPPAAPKRVHASISEQTILLRIVGVTWTLERQALTGDPLLIQTQDGLSFTFTPPSAGEYFLSAVILVADGTGAVQDAEFIGFTETRGKKALAFAWDGSRDLTYKLSLIVRTAWVNGLIYEIATVVLASTS